MLKYVLAFQLVLLLGICAAYGQAMEQVYPGVVLDAQTKEPLVGAIVRVLDDPQKVSIADIQGNFELKVARMGSVQAEVRFLGYESQIAILIPKQTNQVLLERKDETLEAFEIRGEKVREEGTRSLAIVAVNKDAIQQQGTASLGALVAGIQGVSMASFGSNVQLPIIHGLYGNRILILNNGFKHGFQNWGSEHAPEIDIQSAESISVIKGAAAVRFGPDALGGAIITESSRLPLNESLNGRFSTGFQTNGRGYFATLNLAEGKNRWSWNFGGKANIVGDRHAPEYLLTNTGAKEYSVHAGLRYQIRDNLSIKTYYSFLTQDLGILRASIGNSGAALIRNFEAERPVIIRDFSYDINEPNQVISHHLASLKMDWYADEDNHVSLRYAYQLNQRREFDVRRNANLPVIDLDLSSHDLQLDWNKKLGENWNGTFGTQVLTQNNSNNPGTGITPFIPNYQSVRLSTFGIQTYTRGKHEWELGIRYDYENNSVAGRERTQVPFADNFTFSNFTAGLGYVQQFNGRTTFRSNIGSGWRPPNMAELYSFGQHEARQLFGLLRYYEDAEGQLQNDRVIPFGQSGIRAEQSYKWINEIEIQHAKGRFGTSVYANYIGNFIYWRPIGVVGTLRGPMPTYIFTQANAFFTGIDISYDFRHDTHWTSKWGASVIWSRNVERNEPLINQPPININYELSWTKRNLGPLDLLSASLSPGYTFRQFQAPREIPIRALIEGQSVVSLEDEIFDFLAAPDGYFLLNGQLRAKKKNFGLNLIVTNALNTSYRDYLNAMRFFANDLGRNINLSITYKFN